MNNTDTKILAVLDGDYYNFQCPHCNHQIQVHKNDLNCKIFRHAVYKHNMQQISPHMPKILCERLIMNEQVYGCAKPFQLVRIQDSRENQESYEVHMCDYI